MTTQTLANIQATCELIELAKKRIDQHADDFFKDDALSRLTDAQKSLDGSIRMLRSAVTVENLPMVLRSSLRIVKEVLNG